MLYGLRAQPLRELNAWLERYREIWDERLNQLEELIGELEKKKGRKKR